MQSSSVRISRRFASAKSPLLAAAAAVTSFTLDEAEIEIGLGIRGEPGVRRATIAGARELVAELLATIIDRRGLGAGARVARLVNDLGGTPPMELDIVTNMALTYLDERAVRVERCGAAAFLQRSRCRASR